MGATVIARRSARSTCINRCDSSHQWLSGRVPESISLDQLQHRRTTRKFLDRAAEIIIRGFLAGHDRGKERQTSMEIEPICGAKNAGWNGKIKNEEMAARSQNPRRLCQSAVPIRHVAQPERDRN